MRHWILDFVFDVNTGQSRLVIDFNDDSLTALEINTMIRDDEVREEVMALAGRIFGEELEQRLRRGELPVVCLDDEPKAAQQVDLSLGHELGQGQDLGLEEGRGQAW
ncbi:MAG: hypothetical protein ACAI44_13260 [Candidatus Sericytochromatia bacterium]